jgi:hypothetical protein
LKEPEKDPVVGVHKLGAREELNAWKYTSVIYTGIANIS